MWDHVYLTMSLSRALMFLHAIYQFYAVALLILLLCHSQRSGRLNVTSLRLNIDLLYIFPSPSTWEELG